jgi:hypothetical protein
VFAYFCFETMSCCVAHANLKLMILCLHNTGIIGMYHHAYLCACFQVTTFPQVLLPSY